MKPATMAMMLPGQMEDAGDDAGIAPGSAIAAATITNREHWLCSATIHCNVSSSRRARAIQGVKQYTRTSAPAGISVRMAAPAAAPVGGRPTNGQNSRMPRFNAIGAGIVPSVAPTLERMGFLLP